MERRDEIGRHTQHRIANNFFDLCKRHPLRAVRRFRLLFEVIWTVVPKVLNVAAVVLIVQFVFVVVGVALLGELDYASVTVPPNGEREVVPFSNGVHALTNWETFLASFSTMWRMSLGDSWPTLLQSITDESLGGQRSFAAFLGIYHLFVSVIMLNLLVGVLSDTIAEARDTRLASKALHLKVNNCLSLLLLFLLPL